jgi:hypothetical protein
MVKAKTKSKNRKHNLTHKNSHMATHNVSSMAMRAVSNDGSNWHVDTDVNGVRNHENLTNTDIMNIMSHPAHKVDLRTRLLHSLRGVGVGRRARPELDQIGMFGEIEHPHVRIYRNNCHMKPIMMSNLSPLREATIVPRNEVIHLSPLHSLHSMKPVKKYRTKGKKSRKNRK